MSDRNVLVVSTVDHAEDELRAHVGDSDNLKLVVPVVSQGVLDWLANDERAFSQAQHVAEQTADELPGETVEAVAGEADVELAIRDALATFPADEIVIAVRSPDRQGAVESSATDNLPVGSIDGIPVRRLILRDADGAGRARADGPATDLPGAVGPDVTGAGRSASTPFVALGATVVVIAVAFIVALSLAALAYVLAG